MLFFDTDGRLVNFESDDRSRSSPDRSDCVSTGGSLSCRQTLGSALVMASNRCGVEEVQRGSRELQEGIG
jgi:hypothetical protein